MLCGAYEPGLIDKQPAFQLNFFPQIILNATLLAPFEKGGE